MNSSFQCLTTSCGSQGRWRHPPLYLDLRPAPPENNSGRVNSKPHVQRKYDKGLDIRRYNYVHWTQFSIANYCLSQSVECNVTVRLEIYKY